MLRVDEHIARPQPLCNLRSRHHLPLPRNQQDQQLHRLGFHAQRPAVPQQLEPPAIQPELAKLVHPRRPPAGRGTDFRTRHPTRHAFLRLGKYPWCIRESYPWKGVTGLPKLYLRLHPLFIASPTPLAVSFLLNRLSPAEEDTAMKLRNWNWISGLGALALVLSVAPAALAQCGLPNKPIKPSAWHPQFGASSPRLV